ncbi:MAG TPA: PRC-barrel domain-containing protein [Steroidobacteraceae bacterium]|nr:PRC-barrel domain-containing protein [Steroidobacteraceae bacterium]
MANARWIAMLAAIGLVGAALRSVPVHAAQTPAPPDAADTQATPPQKERADPAAASSQHQRDVTQRPGEETAPDADPDPQGASTPHQPGAVGQTPRPGMAGTPMKLVGMQVISPGGESLGSVIDVTMDPQREPEYAVISLGNDMMTAVPYSAVASMVQNGKIVMDRTRLENSPQVAQSELRDKRNSKWRADADKYWSAGAVRMATPDSGTNSSRRPKQR